MEEDNIFQSLGGFGQFQKAFLGAMGQEPKFQFSSGASTGPLKDQVANVYGGIPSSSTVMANPNRMNTAQSTQKASNALVSASEAVKNLMQAGKAIPQGLSEKMNLAAYSRVERDSSGNIIGLTGKKKVGAAGTIAGELAQDWSATAPFDRIDAFKQSQNQPTAIEKQSDPATMMKAQSNRDAFMERIQREAVQKVKDQKLAAGINPETNEVIGGPEVSTEYDSSIFVPALKKAEREASQKYLSEGTSYLKQKESIQQTMQNLAAKGQLTMDKAKTLISGRDALDAKVEKLLVDDERAYEKLNKAEKDNTVTKVTMTPYGFIESKRKRPVASPENQGA